MALQLRQGAAVGQYTFRGLRTRDPILRVAHVPFLRHYGIRSARNDEQSAKNDTGQIVHQDHERYYSYYLKFRVKPKPFRPASWVTDLVRPPTPREEIFDVLQAPSTELEDVRRALEDFIISSSTPETITEKQVLYSRARPGTRALKWFVESGAYDVYDMSAHIRFRRALVHCLIGEGSVDVLWQWLAIPRVPKFAQSWEFNEQGLGKGLLMLDMVNSTAYWSADASRGLDAAVRCFCKGILVSKAAMDSNTAGISLQAAGSWLSSQLKATHARLSLPAFQTFFAAQKGFVRDIDARLFHEACLMMSHPTTPDALPAFDYFQKCSAMASNPTPFVRDLLRNEDARALVPFYVIVRAARMLHKNGEQEKARWLLDFGRESLPSVFSRRSPRLPEATSAFQQKGTMWQFTGAREQGNMKLYVERKKRQEADLARP